jgi:hypothetical protein
LLVRYSVFKERSETQSPSFLGFLSEEHDNRFQRRCQAFSFTLGDLSFEGRSAAFGRFIKAVRAFSDVFVERPVRGPRRRLFDFPRGENRGKASGFVNFVENPVCLTAAARGDINLFSRDVNPFL